MAKIVGVVYYPPSPELPYLAVLLYQGDVLSARAVPSLDAGDAFIANIAPKLAAQIAEDKKKAEKKANKKAKK